MQFPQPGYPPPPPTPPKAGDRFNRWYKSKSQPIQVGLGCAILLGAIVVLFLCSVAGYGAVSGIVAGASNQQVAIATNTPQGVLQVPPADTPILTPVATIALPTATNVPVAAPTQRPVATRPPVPTATPRPRPTQPPPTPTPCASPCNPYGYSFSPGNLIYSPPSDFCNYFNCISSFSNGHGFVNECTDGTYSLSGGIRGDCSSHGGQWRILYSH